MFILELIIMSSKKNLDLETIAVSKNMSEKDCYEMIAECAYYKAEKRGFEPGNDLDDWNEAVEEINAQNFDKLEA